VERELATTLGELEQKLHELERTLTEIGSRAQPADGAAPRGAGESSRVIDEALESRHAAQPPGPVSARATAPPQAPASARATAPPQAPASAQTAAPSAQPAPGSNYSAPPTAAELLRFRERLERSASELTHDYDELLGRLRGPAAAPAGPPISFARGAPSLDIIDVAALREAAMRAFDSDPAGVTAYGTSIGYPRLRAWIADRHVVEPERVLVTNGSMQADAFLFEALVRPGDEVVIERPTYDRTLLSLRQRGARLQAIDLRHDGLDTEALASLLGDRRGSRPKLAHVIPNFQNPAGYTLSEARREALLALAAQYDFVVFEYDPYVALRFSGESLPTMLSMDPERVVYASSFSKTVCPGVRVGYLVGPAETIASIAELATSTYISPSMVAQAIVYEFCASGAIESSIETVRAALAERARTLADALRRELPEAEFVPPEGGYFMWVTLPHATDVRALQKAAGELGVAFVKGADFMLEGGHNALRLAYAGVTPAQIEEGVRRLASAYRSLA
jgi:2-aminoadipate transaminase